MNRQSMLGLQRMTILVFGFRKTTIRSTALEFPIDLDNHFSVWKTHWHVLRLMQDF